MDDSNSPKKVPISKKQALLTIMIAIVAILAVWGSVNYRSAPSKNPQVITKPLSPALASDSDTSSKEISLVLVYKQGCVHCENARKVIENELSKNSKYPIQLTQISIDSEQGQAYQEMYDIRSTPMLIVNNNATDKAYILNNGDTSAVKNFLEKYLIQPTKAQKGDQ